MRRVRTWRSTRVRRRAERSESVRRRPALPTPLGFAAACSCGTLTHVSVTSIAPGARAYRSVRRLARGGMGQVEIVVRREGQFQRVYALKRLHAHYADDPEVRAMFVDEARIAGLIRHANVVSVLDVGEDDGGPFLVMDYVDGPSVSRLCTEAKERGMALPIPIALEVARQAALGLHAAHELRSAEGLPLDVVHRDVSPQNLLIGVDGTVRVTDFGVARALDRITQTDAGCLKGKLGYMSPEQLRFEPLDRRSDVFSLGVVLFELLAMRRLYAGDKPAVFRRILEEAPPSARAHKPEVSEDVDALVRAMLAKDPRARPATAREVASRLDAALRSAGGADLARFLEEHFPDEHERQRAFVAEALTSGETDALPAEATPVLAAPTPTRAPPRGRAPLMIGASLVLLGGALALGYVLALGPAEVSPPATPPVAEALPAPAPVAPEPIEPAPPVEPEPIAAPVVEEAAPPAEPEEPERPRRSARERRAALSEDAPSPPREPAQRSSIPRWGWD